jgi:integrase
MTPSQLNWDDLDATMISSFLNHLQNDRGNSIRTRNVRLTAIRSLFSYAALRHPAHALVIQRVLTIPPKRFDKRIVTFLTAPEVDALIAAPDQSRWEGRRDRALMLLAIQTGLRVSELTGLNCGDVTLGAGANVTCEGQGELHGEVPAGQVLGRAASLRTTRAPFRCTWLSSDLRRDCGWLPVVDGIVAGVADHEGFSAFPCHERRPRGLVLTRLAEAGEFADLVHDHRARVLAQLAPSR